MKKVRFYYEGSKVTIVREYETLPNIGTEVGLLGRPESGSKPPMYIHEIVSIEPVNDDPDADYKATTKYIETKQL